MFFFTGLIVLRLVVDFFFRQGLSRYVGGTVLAVTAGRDWTGRGGKTAVKIGPVVPFRRRYNVKLKGTIPSCR